MEKLYKVGTSLPEWGHGEAQTLTFIVTEDCNLRCKYCYITHKSKGKTLKLETAKKFIDYVLTTDQIERSKNVILDFIGGEPLLEAKLIENICDYFKIRTYELDLPWAWRYQISIGTNGVNYSSAEVQHLIQKNYGKIGIGITVDGTKEKHDLQRVFPDGSGSYDVIHNNLKLWLSQFPGSTKVTFASEDLKYLKDSILQLWKEGIYDVPANVVYEDVWKDGDDKILEEQLKSLADEIIDKDLYDKYYCSFFLDHIGKPYDKDDLWHTSCGAGKMIALSPTGDLYPCMRYYDYSLNHKPGYIIGNVNDGIDMEKARAFLLAMYKYQCDQECLECPIAQGCEFCQGFSYDEADSDTNFQKAKYICKMHKARVRANNYYFARLYHKTGIKRQGFWWKKELVFILGDQYTSFCSFNNNSDKKMVMSRETIEKGLAYAEENFLKPVFVYSSDVPKSEWKEYDHVEILHRLPIEAYKEDHPFYDVQLIVNEETVAEIDHVPDQDNIILNISERNVEKLSSCVNKLLPKCQRINLNIQGLTPEFDLAEYKKQLSLCAEMIADYYKINQELREINVVTDLLFIEEHEGCLAGEDSITYAPDGRFYICPAFYTTNQKAIGSPEEGIHIPNQHLLTEKYMPLCKMCDSYACENCKYINRIYTKEVNVSPSFQCLKAQDEYQSSYLLQEILHEYQFPRILPKKEYRDPIYLLKDKGILHSYYK